MKSKQVGIGNKSKSLKPSPTDIFIFEDNYFSVTESGFWKEFKISKKDDNFKIKNVYIDNPYFTIIPEELYSNITDDQKNRLLTKDPSKLNFFKSLHTAHGSFLYWGIKKSLIEKIQTEMPHSKPMHFCEFLMFSSNEGNKLKFFLGEKIIYISSFLNNKLILINRYNIDSSDDSLYYLLSVIKESKLIGEDFSIDHKGIDDQKLISKVKGILPEIEIYSHKESDYKNS
tara:strand:+ start:2982 stop:3668 length:687 start_codon:yes stop_codon:yes gene_type:complete